MLGGLSLKSGCTTEVSRGGCVGGWEGGMRGREREREAGRQAGTHARRQADRHIHIIYVQREREQWKRLKVK